MTETTLHLMCGKIASGKSTLAKALADEHAAILVSEDRWLSKLYPEEIHSVTDYVRCARRIREVLGPLVVSMLTAGVCVVLDFPANTVSDREWLRTLADRSHAQHCLHYLDVDDETCRARLRARNAEGDHDFAATEAEFDLITSYFNVPGAEEGLVVVVHE
ncbi:AAA family ATPase [Pseudomonas sp. 6D_7.1_Bac1]|uniref:AAA family ATPase n=1 Tax=Pseudomonas sp. 6D_7.1_Bac1 TaxID=2971615 RepID=UPI0021C64052|nr:ATP-binding protein [Pseudomonas sp. 6D_7.1_Bac1]MCU1752102.1 ATP-binding protein [Pseudomonas sp. 6D_7.1_Bac1]